MEGGRGGVSREEGKEGGGSKYLSWSMKLYHYL